MGDVKVPRNLKEGDTFIFQMDVPDEGAVREAQKQQQGGDTDITLSFTSKTDVGASKRRQQGGTGGSSVAGTAISAAATNTSVPSQSCGFLDREIVDARDFVAALAVGILIGVSIVAGFLVGVLVATEP